jgi:6-phosphofructo-2-kinase
MHNTPHSIYLTRHGQSEYNRVGKIGGDSPLTDAGNRYSRKLAQFVEDQVTKNDDGERIKCVHPL